MKTLELVRSIFAQPTAPFREHYVLQKIQELAAMRNLPFTHDVSGNLVVGVKSLKELSRGRRLLLFAHTDHPGFHVQKQNGKLLECRWYGGAPFKRMKNTRVRVYDPSLAKISHEGTIVSIDKEYQRRGISLQVKLKDNARVAKGSFGAFDFPGYKISGNTITTRVADDLAGCVIAFGALLDTRRSPGRVVGVFTRAEEIGFIGCLSFLKNTVLSKDVMAMSLEASRTLPGAILSKGPVLRLGDRSTVFDNLGCQYLWSIAKTIEAKNKQFKYQRRIMDGGSCEATALNLYGIRTTGLSVPLKNYHNQSDDNNKPAPEMINLFDLECGRLICAEAGRQLLKFDTLTTKMQSALEKNHTYFSPLLGGKNRSFLETL